MSSIKDDMIPDKTIAIPQLQRDELINPRVSKRTTKKEKTDQIQQMSQENFSDDKNNNNNNQTTPSNQPISTVPFSPDMFIKKRKIDKDFVKNVIISILIGAALILFFYLLM